MVIWWMSIKRGITMHKFRKLARATTGLKVLGLAGLMAAIVDTVGDPAGGAIVEFVDAVGHAGHDEFLEERLLQITKRTLDLAFAFRVAGLTRLDLHTVMAGELECRRVQKEPPPLRQAEGAHPVGASQQRHATRGVEEPGDPFEGVLTID